MESLPQPPFTVVEEKDLRAIHEAAVRVLVEVGGRVMTEEGRQILLAHGATLEGEDLVKIPAHLVDDALASAPGAFWM